MKKQNEVKGYKENTGLVLLLSLAGMAATFAALWILFLKFYMCVVLTALFSPFIIYKVRKFLRVNYSKRLERQFCDSLVLFSGSLASGMRLEKCINEIAESTGRDYDLLRPEFQRMARLISLNWPVERAFDEFARRSGNHDIIMFATALKTGIPAGINLSQLVRSISAALRVKCDTEAEIDKMLNLPRYNNRVILVMPFAMVLIVRLMAPSYISCLESKTGFIVLCIAAGLIGLGILLGELLGDVKY